MKAYLMAAVAAASMSAGSAVYAQDDYSGVLKARQGQFQIMALNLGILGNMARGNAEYDAEAAQAAADTLVAVSQIQQGPMWPEGSDNMAIDGTRAQPSIWAENDDFLAKWASFGEGAVAIQAVASNGAEALGPAMGGVGGSCKACHDNHRAPAN